MPQLVYHQAFAGGPVVNILIAWTALGEEELVSACLSCNEVLISVFPLQPHTEFCKVCRVLTH